MMYVHDVSLAENREVMKNNKDVKLVGKKSEVMLDLGSVSIYQDSSILEMNSLEEVRDYARESD